MVADLFSGLVLTAVTAWQQVLQMGPYVLGGVVLAAILGQFDLPLRWRRWMGRGGPLAVFGATILGSASPLSTYGTVPLLLQLLREGASPGPALAFLISSSMLNPQLLLLVAGGLGLHMALLQIAGVVLLSGMAGMIASRLPPSLFLHPIAAATGTPSGTSPRRFSWSRLRHDLQGLIGWIGPAFLIGVILGAAIQVFVPDRWVMGLLGNGWAGALLAGILGVPLYTCGGSAVPILAGLTRSGMSPAAALAFLISGPATRITALAAVGSLLNRRALTTYVAYVVAGATVVGVLLG